MWDLLIDARSYPWKNFGFEAALTEHFVNGDDFNTSDASFNRSATEFSFGSLARLDLPLSENGRLSFYVGAGLNYSWVAFGTDPLPPLWDHSDVVGAWAPRKGGFSVYVAPRIVWSVELDANHCRAAMDTGDLAAAYLGFGTRIGLYF